MGTAKDAERKILVELTDLLKRNSKRVLEGETKVCLTTSSLEILLANFRRYSVSEDDDEGEEEGRKRGDNPGQRRQQLDLKRWRETIRTLLDFVLEIKALKIINSAQTMKTPIQIARFSSLQVLEVKKVPIHMVEGLSKLRGQLKEIIVSKSLVDLQGWLEICGGDRSSGLVWSCLTTAILSFNGLKSLDTSIRLVPFLEVLDLSHNNLKDTEEHLQTLSDVAKLNLGYNLLCKVPKLSMSNKLKLRTLVLRNNNLDNLEGVEELSLLEELDVSENCFVDHKVLQVLPPLTRLRALYLVGNPFCYKPDHRQLTLKKLSPQTAMTVFILDGQKMSANEISIVRSNHYQVRRSVVEAEDQADAMETIVVKHTGKGMTAKHLDPNEHENNRKRGHRRVPSKERVPTIGNIQEAMLEKHALDTSPVVSFKDETDFMSDLEKDKERYEILREHYKDDWLKALSAEQGVYDRPAVHTETGEKDIANGIGHGTKKAEENVVASGAKNVVSDIQVPDISVMARDEPDSLPTSPTSPKQPIHIGQTTDIYARKISRKHQVEERVVPPVRVEPVREELLDREPEIDSGTDSEDQYGDESEPLIVMLPDKDLTQIFITVNNRYILEKDTGGQKISSLDLKCLQGVVKGEERLEGKDIVDGQVFTVLTLDFDYVKKDMRQRKYAMEDDHDTLMFESLIYPHLKIKQDLATAVVQVQCLKCEHRFSQRAAAELVSCPSCNSKLVIKVEEAEHQLLRADLQRGEPEQRSHEAESPPDEGHSPARAKKSPVFVRKRSKYSHVKENKSGSDLQNLQKETFAGTLGEFVDEALDEADKRSSLYRSAQDMTLEDEMTPNVDTSAGPSLKPNNSWSDVQRMTSSSSVTRSSISSVESDITVLATHSSKSVSVISESSLEILQGGNRTEFSEDLETHISVSNTQSLGIPEQKDEVSSQQFVKNAQGLITPVGSPLSNSVCSSMVSSVYENTLAGGGEGNTPGSVEENAGNVLDSSFTSSSSDSVSIRHSAGSADSRGRRSKNRHATMYLNKSDAQSSEVDSIGEFNKSLEEVLSRETSSLYNTALSQHTTESSLNTTNSSTRRIFPSIYDKPASDSDSERPNDSDSFLGVTRRSHDSVSSRETTSSSPRKRSGNRSRSRSANRSAIYGDVVLEESVESQASSGVPEFPTDLSPIKKIPGKQTDNSSLDGSTNSQSQGAVSENVSRNGDTTSVSVASGSNSMASGENALPWEQEDSSDKSGKHESLIHDEFVNIDHRLQLYLELHVLRSEELIQCAIQCPIVQYMMPNEVKSLLVVTTTRIMILRIQGEMDSDVSADYLKLYEDQPITELQYVDIGLGYQSLRLEFSTMCSSFTLLICDEARCKQFLTLLSDIVQTVAIHEHSKLEGISKSNPATLANIEQLILEAGEDDVEDEEGEGCQKFVRYLLVRYMDPDVEEDEGRIMGMVVTTTDLILVQENHQWPLPRLQGPLSEDLKGKQFTVVKREKINNIETFAFNEESNSALRLTFFESSGGSDDAAWYITMETTKGVKSLVDAIRDPWEEEFGVSLEVTSSSFTEDSRSNENPL